MGATDRSVIDLRSDVVAPPTDEMWEAMRRSTLGWALVGEDPAVNELKALGAEILAKEAALLVGPCHKRLYVFGKTTFRTAIRQEVA